MRMTIWLLALAVIIVAVLVIRMALRNSGPEVSAGPKSVHVVLIGASIGQGWQLAEWPTRAQAPGFSAESIPAWQFDKSEVVEEVLMRPARKFRLTRTYLRSLVKPPPRKADIAIVKECSSYFPGDIHAYEAEVLNWVRRLQSHQVQVVLATVVPVTKARAERDPGKQESLLAYNRWVREYAREQSISVLDLEAALRTEAPGAYLREEWATEDGSHLNAAAYRVLDQTLRAVLCGDFPSCNAVMKEQQSGAISSTR